MNNGISVRLLSISMLNTVFESELSNSQLRLIATSLRLLYRFDRRQWSQVTTTIFTAYFGVRSQVIIVALPLAYILKKKMSQQLYEHA